ncbi:50S ribosomal protein L4 [Lentilactobacillus parafarraginis]|nr:50S ribosomal protein L4 [Lentilactobacillus parafarraginis]
MADKQPEKKSEPLKIRKPIHGRCPRCNRPMMINYGLIGVPTVGLFLNRI